MTGRIWEHRTNTLRADKIDDYLLLWQRDIQPMYDQQGIEVFGCWLWADDRRKHFWMRRYDGEPDRIAKTAATRARSDWSRIWDAILDSEEGAEIRDFREISATETGLGSPSPGGGPFGWYQYRYVHVRPGARDELVDGFVELFRPIQREIGLTLIGPWLPEDDENGFLSIWAFADAADWNEMRARLVTHPRFTEDVGKLQAMEERITSRFLQPTPASPIGRYLR